MRISLGILLVVCAVTFAVSASAATEGFDNTTASAYSGGWHDGDNGAVSGAPFGAWSLSGDASHFFLGNSANGGASNPGINTGGTCFGLYGVNQTFSATRSFSSALAVGQTFSADLTVNFRNGFKGIDLRDASGTTLLNFNTTNDDYVVNNDAANYHASIGNTYSSDTEFHVAFTQTSSSGGTWSITRSGGVADFDTGTYSGLAAGFKLYVNTTDGTTYKNDLYANNFAIVPEPATYLGGLLMLATGGLQFYRMRRRPTAS